MEPYQELPFRTRVNLGAMTMKGYSAFPKAPSLLEPHHQIIYYHIQDTHWGGVLSLCRDAFSIFCNSGRRGWCRSSVHTKLTKVFCRSTITGISLGRTPSKNVTYEFILSSPACIASLTWMFREMGGKWPYICFFIKYCFQDLLKTERTILL